MTAWQATDVIPKEVTSFIENMKCPICKGNLSVDKPDFSVLTLHHKEFTGLSNCVTNPEEYWISLVWKDPKYIFLEDETLAFWDEEREYAITRSYPNPGTPMTHVRVSNLDESGSAIDQDAISFDVTGAPFDFDRFNVPFYVSLIKTLAIFK